MNKSFRRFGFDAVVQFLGYFCAVLFSAATLHASEPIRIGFIAPLTGPASSAGVAEQQAIILLIEQENAKGGVLGRQLQLISYDDQADPTKSANFAIRLLETDKADIILGPSTTGATMAIIRTVEEARVPMISMAGGGPIVKPVKEWVFKTPHSDLQGCEFLFSDFQRRGFQRIAMISDTGAFGASMRKECLDVAKGAKIQIVADESYDPRDVDVTAQLTNIKKANAQAVLNAGFGSGPVVVTRGFRALDFQIPLYQSHAVPSAEYLKLAGGSAEGVRLAATGLVVASILPENHPQSAVVKPFKEAFEKRWNVPVSTFAAQGFDAFWLAINAIKAANSTDKAAVRTAIEKTKNYSGANGTYNMSAADHNGVGTESLWMVEVKNGNWAMLK